MRRKRQARHANRAVSGAFAARVLAVANRPLNWINVNDQLFHNVRSGDAISGFLSRQSCAPYLMLGDVLNGQNVGNSTGQTQVDQSTLVNMTAYHPDSYVNRLKRFQVAGGGSLPGLNPSVKISVLRSIGCYTVINQGLARQNFRVYKITPRDDLNAVVTNSGVFDIARQYHPISLFAASSSQDQIGGIPVGAGLSVLNPSDMDHTPFMSTFFCQKWRVLRSTTMSLAAGASRRFCIKGYTGDDTWSDVVGDSTISISTNVCYRRGATYYLIKFMPSLRPGQSITELSSGFNANRQEGITYAPGQISVTSKVYQCVSNKESTAMSFGQVTGGSASTSALSASQAMVNSAQVFIATGGAGMTNYQGTQTLIGLSVPP